MPHREVALLAALVVASVVAGIGAADPPQSGTERNGLTENESATLWSRDADEYIAAESYRQQYGDSRTAMEQLANGTDITFKRPPATAATWTRNDFEDLESGGHNTSIHPTHATLVDGKYIADAHATIFAVHPSTRGHLESGDTPLYVAPSGTVRGFVDYRVRVPNGSTSENRTVTWSLANTDVFNVRLWEGNETITEAPGSHTPALGYHVDDDWSTTLSLEAQIYAVLKNTTRIDRGNETVVHENYRVETLNVSDSIDVEIYNLTATPYFAEYPNGDSGVAIFQARPWQGYTLTEPGDARIRGVWRFYTARDTDWDTLVMSNRTDRSTTESDAIPVYVHAYPSQIGPRAEPVLDGPEILETWGDERSVPQATLGENINVEIVNQPYTTTYGVAVRAESIDREALDVAGIVRGVSATLEEPDGGSERQLRDSNLTVEILDQDESQATLCVTLRDNQTGAPIMLAESGRRRSIADGARDGYITVAGQQVKTDKSGVATVTVDEPGIYTARYHPGSWLGHDTAYVSDTATVRWHPLGTIDGWFAFLFEVGWQLIPFLVMLYAGQRLLRMITPKTTFQRNP